MLDNVIIMSPSVLSVDRIEMLDKRLNFSLTESFDLFKKLLVLNRFARLQTIKRNSFNVPSDNNLQSGNIIVVNTFRDLKFGE